MPRYHFHIRENGRLVKDEEGQEFHDRTVVRKEAIETGASIARDVFTSGSASLVIVDVRSEDQTCLRSDLPEGVDLALGGRVTRAFRHTAPTRSGQLQATEPSHI